MLYMGYRDTCSKLGEGYCCLMANEAQFGGKVEMLPVALSRLSDDELKWLRVNHVPDSVGASPIQECVISSKIYNTATDILKLRGKLA